MVSIGFELLLLDFDDFPALVLTAMRANPVG
jgi:hypothetical protein